MKTILHTVDIKGTAKQVYHALTAETGLSGWWTTKVAVKGGEGGLIDFTFGGDFNPDMVITQLEDAQLVAWKCVSGHEPWTDNTFSFRLEPRSPGCVLHFQQEYARELDDETYGRYNFNWAYYLESLRLLVETGEGKPYRA
jgi:uncharacterized protein YndB with AHSA1/START domain